MFLNIIVCGMRYTQQPRFRTLSVCPLFTPDRINFIYWVWRSRRAMPPMYRTIGCHFLTSLHIQLPGERSAHDMSAAGAETIFTAQPGTCFPHSETGRHRNALLHHAFDVAINPFLSHFIIILGLCGLVSTRSWTNSTKIMNLFENAAIIHHFHTKIHIFCSHKRDFRVPGSLSPGKTLVIYMICIARK